MRSGGGQRPFNERRNVQICDKQHAKRFSRRGVPLRRTEGLHENMVHEKGLCNPAYRFWK